MWDILGEPFREDKRLKHRLVPCREVGLVELALEVGEVRRVVNEGDDRREVDARHDALKRRRENAIAVLRDKIDIDDLLAILL